MELTVSELKQIFYENYDLEEAIIDRLEFAFITKVGKQGNTKNVRIDDDGETVSILRIRRNDDSNSPDSLLKLEDITVKVRQIIGDEIEEDASCDSKYMIGAMDRVGKAIRKSYAWVPMTQKCYLVMDNAGGHGSNVAIATYRKDLLDNYNIEIIFQIPRSPYTNVLDLGVWMSLQAQVERQDYLKRCNADALVNFVMKSWEDGNLDHSITKVFLRLKPVLCNILEANGSNDLVECKRGKKYDNIKMEEIMRDMEDSNSENPTNLQDEILLDHDVVQEDLDFEDEEL